MDNWIHITQYTDEWKMHTSHKELILEYAKDVFKVPEDQFIFLKDDDGYTHLFLPRNHPSLKDQSEDEIRRSCSWIDGFVWGLSYTQLKRKKKQNV